MRRHENFDVIRLIQVHVSSVTHLNATDVDKSTNMHINKRKRKYLNNGGAGAMVEFLSNFDRLNKILVLFWNM